MGQGEKLSPLRPEDRDSDYPGSSHLKGSSLEGAQSWAALSDLGAEHIWPPELLSSLSSPVTLGW